MKGYWTVKENYWKPPVRLGSNLVCYGNKIYMFGGYNKQAINDLYILEPKKA